MNLGEVCVCVCVLGFVVAVVVAYSKQVRSSRTLKQDDLMPVKLLLKLGSYSR